MNLNREDILQTIRLLEYCETIFRGHKNINSINKTIGILVNELPKPITDEEYNQYLHKKRKEEFNKSTKPNNCITNWDLRNKIKPKPVIKTSYDFKKIKPSENNDLELSEYVNKIMESAIIGEHLILVDSIKFNILVSLEKLGFKVEWVDNTEIYGKKGWLIKW